MDYLIIDIDGCISDDRWRMEKVDFSIEDLDERYAEYNAACFVDRPIVENVNFVKGLLRAFALTPVFLTARPRAVEKATRDWLGIHFAEFLGALHFDLLMRPDNDKRTSPELKPRLLRDFLRKQLGKDSGRTLALEELQKVALCIDDREDVIEAYNISGFRAMQLCIPGVVPACEAHGYLPHDESCPPGELADVLQTMTDTSRERGKVYGNSFFKMQPIIKALWPNGVPAGLCETHQWHIFELVINKLIRFANTDLTHIDSVHDAGVYCAIIEFIIRTGNGKGN